MNVVIRWIRDARLGVFATDNGYDGTILETLNVAEGFEINLDSATLRQSERAKASETIAVGLSVRKEAGNRSAVCVTGVAGLHHWTSGSRQCTGRRGC